MQGNAGSVADIVGIVDIVDIKLRSTVHTSTSMSSDALAARWWQVLLLRNAADLEAGAQAANTPCIPGHQTASY